MGDYGLLYTNDNKNQNYLNKLDEFDFEETILMSKNEQKFVQYLKNNEKKVNLKNTVTKNIKTNNIINTITHLKIPVTEEERNLSQIEEWAKQPEGAEAVIRHYIYGNLLMPKDSFLNDSIYSKCNNLFQKITCKSCYQIFLNQ